MVTSQRSNPSSEPPEVANPYGELQLKSSFGEISSHSGQNPKVATGSQVQLPVLHKKLGWLISVRGAVTRVDWMLARRKGSG